MIFISVTESTIITSYIAKINHIPECRLIHNLTITGVFESMFYLPT